MAKYYIKNSRGQFSEVVCGQMLGSPGGQGAVYRILQPSNHSVNCIKIYHDSNKFEYDRIDFMLKNPPVLNNQDRSSFMICWPVDIVYNEQKNPTGYIMPLAFDGSRDLKILEWSKNNKTIADNFKDDDNWHDKFERYDMKGINNRLKIMHNWALAVYRVHEVGCYVLVDLKPENVLATHDGKISIVDTDSFQITDTNGRIMFKGPVATPPYFPIYGYTLKKQNLPMVRACDRFAISIVFYQILIGVHPYVGTINRSHIKAIGYSKYLDECSQIEECIQARLFVFGDNKTNFSIAKGTGHERFHTLPKNIQDLFVKTFNGDGSKSPSLVKWLTELQDAIKSIDQGVSTITPIAKPNQQVNAKPFKITYQQPSNTAVQTSTTRQKPKPKPKPQTTHQSNAKQPKTSTPAQSSNSIGNQSSGGSSNVQQSTSNKTKNKNLILGGLGLIAVIAAIGAFVLLGGKSDDVQSTATTSTPVTTPVGGSTSTPTDVIEQPNNGGLTTAETDDEIVKKPIEVDPKPTPPPVDPTSLNFDYANYEGPTKNGKPNGNGTMRYTKRTLISKHDSQKRYAEPGQYVKGNWRNGELTMGTLHNSDGSQSGGLINIGSR